MKPHLRILLLTALLIGGCSQNNTRYTSAEDRAAADEKEQIKDVVRQVYKWHEADTSKDEIAVLTDSKDSIYIGIDLRRHNERLNELRSAKYFSDEFVSNYDKIVRTIDKKLKNGEYKWLVGDLPPFGNDADPWCNCQDVPDSGWQDKIKFTFVSLDSERSSLTWTWDDPSFSKGFAYAIRVVKVNGSWKIAYLQGFDFNQFVEKN